MIPHIVINGIEPIIFTNSFGIYKRHEYRFPNGYGASVIYNPYSYGLELAVLKDRGGRWELCYTTPITDDVVGYIEGEDELKELLTEIYNLE